MCDDSKKLYNNRFENVTPNEFETFTWKIPNVSSIPQTIDYVVQSPSFSFGGSDWVLKMYPFGRTGEGSEGCVDVVLEKLCYQVKQESVLINIFCEDIFGKKFYNSDDLKYLSTLQTRPTVAFNSITRSLKDNPEKWRIAPNDTFKLVCALHKENRQNLPTELSQQNLARRYRTGENDEIEEIGEIYKEYSAMACFMFKICDIEPVPDGYEIRLPLSFANASWMLKIYPYSQMQNSKKRSVDIVLERLHSEISEHYVVLEIIMSIPRNSSIEQSCFFNAHHTQGDAINFQNPVEAHGRDNCIHFDMNIRMKMIGTPEDQTKSIKPAEGDNSVSGNSVVLQNFKKLYLQQEDCDVVFKVKGKEFSSHRLILKAQSPVLASAFRIDMKEKATGIFDVEDCEPSIFSDFLHFLYCGEVENLSKDNVFDLFTIADKYDVPDLKAMCLKFIKINLSVETFCDTIVLALLHSDTELLKLSTDFFANNLQKIIVTVKWQSFVVENPIQGNELMIKALVPTQRDTES